MPLRRKPRRGTSARHPRRSGSTQGNTRLVHSESVRRQSSHDEFAPGVGPSIEPIQGELNDLRVPEVGLVRSRPRTTRGSGDGSALDYSAFESKRTPAGQVLGEMTANGEV
jgi:hypothetical protein